MSNSTPQKQLPFSVAISSKGYQQLIQNTLRDEKRASRFITAITSAVATNPQLAECDTSSILASALVGESLGLLPNPALGHFYLIPYKQKEKYDKAGNLISPAKVTAQFQLGYRGLIQLALRTGSYRKLNALAIKQGEFISYNPLTEDLKLAPFEDPAQRDQKPTVGYAATFEYLNGFKKTIFWTREQMLHHADKYSMAFSAEDYEKLQKGEIPEKDMWKYSSFWYKNFDQMAIKTMLKQLITHWGIMSSELADAFADDERAMTIENGKIVDAETVSLEPPMPEAVSLDEI